MDVGPIPRTFWHAVSLSILVVTAGLVAIAFRSASVTIEIANTKIVLSQALAEAERANEEILASIESAERDYERQAARLEEVVRELPPAADGARRRLEAVRTEPPRLDSAKSRALRNQDRLAELRKRVAPPPH